MIVPPAPVTRTAGGSIGQDYARVIDDHDAVLRANAAFYEAFEARDIDAMSDLWERSERAVCTHPGWSTLRGWGPIASSFVALFANPGSLQFILTDCHVFVQESMAWVSVDENLLGDGGGATIAAINIFARTGDGRWQVVAHHGSPVHAPVGAAS